MNSISIHNPTKGRNFHSIKKKILHPRVPCDDLQSQHSLGIGLSLCCVSFPQQLKQRPSSDNIWLAGHRVQSLMLGPWQPSQDGSQALQFGLSVSGSWSNNRHRQDSSSTFKDLSRRHFWRSQTVL